MKTVGIYLRDSRRSQKKSLADLEKVTRIKKDFIRSVEKESWSKLPDYPVVSGFVKSIAGALSLNQARVVAMLRRDYPPQSVSINPKADVLGKFVWSPKLTFFAGIIIVTVTIVGYLGFQYYNFVQPPALEIYLPANDDEVFESTLVVSGKTNPESVVRVNNQPVIVKEDGVFVTTIEVFQKTQEVLIKSVSRSGKETVISRKIVPQLEE